MPLIIEAESLSHVYSKKTPFEKVAIENINIGIERGSFVGIIGHTGSGKSTFIQHLNGLLEPTSGKILYEGVDVNQDAKTRRDVRFKVGLVFQYPEYQLFEETVYKDIAFGPKNMKLSEAEVDERVREAAELVGVTEDLFERSPLELSGGQKRRVAIAGVMAMRPGVLVLDEPTAGLDPAGCAEILDNIKQYREKTGCTVLLVTHNMDDAANIAERLIVFSGGAVIMDGSPSEVFCEVERLMEIGLDIPAPAAIATALRERGVDLARGIYTMEALKASLLEIGRGRVGD